MRRSKGGPSLPLRKTPPPVNPNRGQGQQSRLGLEPFNIHSRFRWITLTEYGFSSHKTYSNLKKNLKILQESRLSKGIRRNEKCGPNIGRFINSYLKEISGERNFFKLILKVLSGNPSQC